MKSNKKGSKKISDVLIPILCFHSLIINFSPGNAIGQYLQLACSFLTICFLYSKRVYLNANSNILWSIFFLFVTMCVSTIYVRSQHALGQATLSSPFTPLLLYGQLLSFYGLSVYASYRNRWYTTLSVLYYVSLLYIAIISVYSLSLGKNDNPDFVFIFLNKFDFSYLLLFSIALYIGINPYLSKKKHVFFFLYVLFAGFMSYWVGCITGILLVVFMTIVIILGKLFSHVLLKKSVLLLSLPVLDITFFIFFSIIVAHPAISFFIENVLGKDSSLTGRLYIYEAMYNIISERPLFGFGPRNGTIAMSEILRMPNSQNGLLYLYLEIGLLGLSVFFYIFYLIIKNIKLKFVNYGILVYLYSIIIASIVEITIGINFLCYAFLLIVNPYKKESIR